MLTLTSDNLASLVAVECSLSPLTIWLRWEQAGSGGMLTLTSLTIWLRWEQAFGGGSGFAGSSGSGFAGSKLVAADWASLVGGSYMMLWKNNRRVKYPMLVIVLVMVGKVMVMAVMVMVLMVLMVMTVIMMVVVVKMMVEKRGSMECMQYEKFASLCNSILHMVTPV
jgi:hypothetical protein